MTVEYVIFDWAGTLTPWHTVDLRASGRKPRPPCTGSVWTRRTRWASVCCGLSGS